MRPMPMAARAKQKYRPSMLRWRSEKSPNALSAGTPATAKAARARAHFSSRTKVPGRPDAADAPGSPGAAEALSVFMPSFRGEQAGGAALEEEDDQPQQGDLGVDALQE